MTHPRILIAGIGNIFLGDDAFGVEVAQRLARHKLPEDVRVVDFGIRALDLTYALLDPYESIILVDATARGGSPGTLYLIEPAAGQPHDENRPAAVPDAHSMDPVKVLQMAAEMGASVQNVLLVGCEITPIADPDEFQDGLSEPVRAAVDEAVPFILSIVERLLRSERLGEDAHTTIPETEVGSWRT